MKLKNIFIAGLALNLGLSACTGTFLDENTNPNYLTPSTFWKSEGDILKGLTSAYAYLQPFTHKKKMQSDCVSETVWSCFINGIWMRRISCSSRWHFRISTVFRLRESTTGSAVDGTGHPKRATGI